MKMISRLYGYVIALVAVSLIGCATSATKPADGSAVAARSDINIDSVSKLVVVDQGEPVFTVFTGIPEDIGGERFQDIKLKVAENETLTMLTWQEFLEHVDEYARSVVLRNDYPNIKIVDGIVCLVASKRGVGAPWGLTWNGGIALTFNDYQHARRTYESYKADPAAYKPIRDQRRDPINPGGFLAFGGCN
jgi:hypothetical protein